MSFIKFFAPPEWDADVPDKTNLENLTKKNKLKKKKKDLDDSYNHEPSAKKVKRSESSDQNISFNTDIYSDVREKNKPKKENLAVITPVKSNKDEGSEKKKATKNNLDTSKVNLESEVKLTSKKGSQKKKKKKKNSTINSISLNPENPKTNDEIKMVNGDVQQSKNIGQPTSKNAKKKLSKKGKDSAKPNKEVNNSSDTLKKLTQAEKNKKRRRKKNKNVDSPNPPKLTQTNHSKGNTSEINNSSDTPKNLTQAKKNNKRRRKKSKNLGDELTETKMEKDTNGENKVKIVSTQSNKRDIFADKSNHKKKLEKSASRNKKNKAEESIESVNGNEFKISSKSKTISKDGKKTLKKPLFKAHLEKLNSFLNEQIKKTEDTGEEKDSENLATKINKKVDQGPKTLRQRMMEKLRGAKFRYLNEQMYIKESKDAVLLFNEDPSAFKSYHNGYRQQVSKWPLNPLDVIIKDISNLPKEYVIADLGCGDGRLSKSVPHKVHSFDLVSLDPCIQACDMSHTPLLSSQVNVVVFCLSLMGTNLMDYIIEANRILKTGGLLKIAEVESRFENLDNFLKDVQKYGFSLLKSDFTHNLFYFMDFKKESDIKKRNKLPNLILNPCLYKKR